MSRKQPTVNWEGSAVIQGERYLPPVRATPQDAYPTGRTDSAKQSQSSKAGTACPGLHEGRLPGVRAMAGTGEEATMRNKANRERQKYALTSAGKKGYGNFSQDGPWRKQSQFAPDRPEQAPAAKPTSTGAAEDKRAKQSQFLPSDGKGQVLCGKMVIANRTCQGPGQNKANFWGRAHAMDLERVIASGARQSASVCRLHPRAGRLGFWIADRRR